MTRVLSEMLGHSGPGFQLQLRQLERGAGMPSHDIRLSTEVLHGSMAKLKRLGLDPHDTRGNELYAMLGARLRQDEQHFAQTIQASSPKSDDPIAHVALALERQLAGHDVFALKPAAAKRLLKANLPKKTMKSLGYRSADSMLKHESVASLNAAALLIESDQWLKKQLAAYSKLKGTDFETRRISIEHPTSKRWQELAESIVAQRRHNIIAFKELGTVVLLPLPSAKPDLVTLTTAVLALHATNEIYAASTFLKLHQVQASFGELVRSVATTEPQLASRAMDQPFSWHTVQRYYARFADAVRTDIFEPFLHADDFVWNSVEQALAEIDEQLAFWKQTGPLALHKDGETVPYNITDQLLSHCNQLPYERRIVQYFRHELNQELSLRYLNRDRFEQAIGSLSARQLVTEPANI